MDQNRLPLYEALIKHSQKSIQSFHVPGHKNGTLLPETAKNIFQTLMKIDVTELSGLDDLHHPTGVIMKAEQLTSKLYGSIKSYFLVGGSTVGNLSMIMATCNEGDYVLVQRNSHKSIMNALRLANVNPIFIQPKYDHDAKVATCIDESSILEIIEMYPFAKALIITNPNYYGYTISLKKIISEAHKHNIVVLVDEAHGAHFGHASSLLPEAAIKQGADVVVQSAHKTLPAMTMASFLHYNSNLVNLEKLNHYLQLFQSSSPSYPLMASLDIARHFLANLSEKQLKDTIEKINSFKKSIDEIQQIKVLESNEYVVDPLKVTVQSQCDLSGFQLQSLFEEVGIYTELADQNNVLFVLPLVITEDLHAISKKIKQQLTKFVAKKQKNRVEKFHNDYSITKLALSYKEMEQFDIEVIPLRNSVGKIISEEIIPYPPGIPLLLSGEKITEIHVNKLNELHSLGAHFQGNDFFKTGVKVFKI